MLATQRRAQLLLLLLLMASTLAFVSGVALERRSAGERATGTAASGDVHSASEVGGENVTGTTTDEATTGVATTGAAETTASETHPESSRASVLGVSPESLGVVSVAVVISLVLGLALWLRRSRALLAGALVLGLLFAAFDILEAFHQADEAHSGLLAMAALVATLHLLVAAVAAWELRPRSLAQLAHFAPAT